LRHIWRALVEELRDRHIIEVVKQYTWQTWKVMVRHPNLTNPSSAEEKTLQNQSEMSEVQPSTADATVPSYRSIQRTTDTEAAVVDLILKPTVDRTLLHRVDHSMRKKNQHLVWEKRRSRWCRRVEQNQL
jgi:hypothetical protein